MMYEVKSLVAGAGSTTLNSKKKTGQSFLSSNGDAASAAILAVAAALEGREKYALNLHILSSEYCSSYTIFFYPPW